MQGKELADALDHCLAYQTPPYEIKKQNEPSSPQQASSSATSSDILITQIASMVSKLTMHRCTNKIKNDYVNISGFLREVLKRSKCNRKVALLATLYFQKINFSVKQDEELPEFARCSKRIFLSCLILAHKFLNDNTFSLKTWHLISGLNQKDLSFMERWCLAKLDYRLLVKEDDLNCLHSNLLRPTSKRSFEEVDQEEVYSCKRRLSRSVALVVN